MTIQATETIGTAPRFSKQQKALLLWMLERDALKEFLIEDESDKYRPYKGSPIPWSSKDFLGDDPTNNQSSTLSRALSSLERRKLVELQRSKGKQARTTHLLFTRTGRIFAEALSKGYTIGASTRETKTLAFTADDTARWNMLDVSILLLKRELKRIEFALEVKTDDYTSFDIPRVPAGGTSKTREHVERSRAVIDDALKAAENERSAGSRKFKEVLQDLIDMGLINEVELNAS